MQAPRDCTGVSLAKHTKGAQGNARTPPCCGRARRGALERHSRSLLHCMRMQLQHRADREFLSVARAAQTPPQETCPSLRCRWRAPATSSPLWEGAVRKETMQDACPAPPRSVRTYNTQKRRRFRERQISRRELRPSRPQQQGLALMQPNSPRQAEPLPVQIRGRSGQADATWSPQVLSWTNLSPDHLLRPARANPMPALLQGAPRQRVGCSLRRTRFGVHEIRFVSGNSEVCAENSAPRDRMLSQHSLGTTSRRFPRAGPPNAPKVSTFVGDPRVHASWCRRKSQHPKR